MKYVTWKSYICLISWSINITKLSYFNNFRRLKERMSHAICFVEFYTYALHVKNTDYKESESETCE